MHPISTTPTVAELTRARESAPRLRAARMRVPGAEGLVHEALRRALSPATRVFRRQAVETPAGRIVAPLVFAGGGRRVAVSIDDPDDGDPDGTAALLLVYGAFDVVYRVRRDALAARAPVVAWEVARRERTLFVSAAVAALRLCAASSPSAIPPVRADRVPSARMFALRQPDVRPVRINRPSEWADDFERRIRREESERAPLFAMTA